MAEVRISLALKDRSEIQSAICLAIIDSDCEKQDTKRHIGIPGRQLPSRTLQSTQKEKSDPGDKWKYESDSSVERPEKNYGKIRRKECFDGRHAANAASIKSGPNQKSDSGNQANLPPCVDVRLAMLQIDDADHSTA